MDYTKEQLMAMYLDWFNNFISTSAFQQHYNLGIAEAENVIDEGRRLYKLNTITN